MKNDLSFDVVVIGGGHAGCEAAAASARLGVNTALFTHKIETIGEMSCNPAIGGLGKGHLVREIDALDGLMGEVADKSGIQFRLLNRSRGPAVQGPRTQSDRSLYRKYMQEKLLNYCNLTVFSDPVIKFIFDKNGINAFETQSGKKVSCSKLILTTGTFLNGLIHIGDEKTPAGRYNEKPSTGLSEQLKKYNFKIGRLKTGTPPRLDARTINFKNLEEQYDIIILDPPAFAKHMKVKHKALQGYKRLNTRAIEQIKPNGILFTFSCSQVIDNNLFRHMVLSSAIAAGRNVSILKQMHQPADHPINIFHPESEYLKGLVLKVE